MLVKLEAAFDIVVSPAAWFPTLVTVPATQIVSSMCATYVPDRHCKLPVIAAGRADSVMAYSISQPGELSTCGPVIVCVACVTVIWDEAEAFLIGSVRRIKSSCQRITTAGKTVDPVIGNADPHQAGAV